MELIHLTQKQLACRWILSEATLERWRSEGIGPTFLKLQGQVRYRMVDVEAYEESCLATSTKSIRQRIKNGDDQCAMTGGRGTEIID